MGSTDHVYDDIFQTLRCFHPRLFIPYINLQFGKEYPMDAKIQMLTRDGRLLEKRMDGRVEQFSRETDLGFSSGFRKVRRWNTVAKILC